MRTLTQEEMEALNVGDIVEVFLENKDEDAPAKFLRTGWVKAVVIPSTYLGSVMFYTFLRIRRDPKNNRNTLEKRLNDDDNYNNHALWVGYRRPDLVRKLDEKFLWSWRAKG